MGKIRPGSKGGNQNTATPEDFQAWETAHDNALVLDPDTVPLQSVSDKTGHVGLEVIADPTKYKFFYKVPNLKIEKVKIADPMKLRYDATNLRMEIFKVCI